MEVAAPKETLIGSGSLIGVPSVEEIQSGIAIGTLDVGEAATVERLSMALAQQTVADLAKSQAISDYVNASSKPWCYASLGVAGGGALGGEVAVVYGANVDDPPAWIVTGFAVANAFFVVTIVKTATNC